MTDKGNPARETHNASVRSILQRYAWNLCLYKYISEACGLLYVTVATD